MWYTHWHRHYFIDLSEIPSPNLTQHPYISTTTRILAFQSELELDPKPFVQGSIILLALSSRSVVAVYRMYSQRYCPGHLARNQRALYILTLEMGGPVSV